VRLFGRHNIEPVLLAAACAKELGMSLNDIAHACQKFEPAMGGIRRYKGIKDITMIDASYASNPDGAIAHLEYLALFPAKSDCDAMFN